MKVCASKECLRPAVHNTNNTFIGCFIILNHLSYEHRYSHVNAHYITIAVDESEIIDVYGIDESLG